MIYEQQGYTITGLSMDNEKKEIHILVDILVGIQGADTRFQTNNPNIDFIIKGFSGYDELVALINEASLNWVKQNYIDSE